MHNNFHDDKGNLHELHAVKHYFTVEEEGDPDLFIDAATLGQEREGQQVPLPPVIHADVNGVNHGCANELIAALTGVVEIDDNNEPAPENIPVPESATTSPILHSSWGHSGFCFRKQEGLPNNPAKLSSPVDTTRNDINLQLFECLFPWQYVEVLNPGVHSLAGNPEVIGIPQVDYSTSQRQLTSPQAKVAYLIKTPITTKPVVRTN